MKIRFLYTLLFMFLTPLHLSAASDVKQLIESEIDAVMIANGLEYTVPNLALILLVSGDIEFDNVAVQDFLDDCNTADSDVVRTIIQLFINKKCNIKDSFYLTDAISDDGLTVEQAELIFESTNKITIPEFFSSAFPFATQISPVTMSMLVENGYKDLIVQDSFMAKMLQKFVKLNKFVEQSDSESMSDQQVEFLFMVMAAMYDLQENIEYVKTLKSGFSINKNLVKEYEKAYASFNDVE